MLPTRRNKCKMQRTCSRYDGDGNDTGENTISCSYLLFVCTRNWELPSSFNKQAVFYEPARARGTEEKIGQLCPMRRGAFADEIARVVLFLGSDEASYVTGQAWAACGGLSSGLPYKPGAMA